MPNEAFEEDNRAFYTSALHSQNSITRRRHSGSTSDNSHSWSGPPSRHKHTRTDSAGGRSNGPYSHPLTSNQNGLQPDSPGVTRPHLARVTKKIDDEMTGDFEEDDAVNRQEEEREVIVHEVTSADSLAGVSLKYGISLADLRRANHLWASDSIHLRKVLYIPLDVSSRARELVRELRLSAAPLIDFETALSAQSPVTTAESSELLDQLNLPTAVGVGVQKIPMSRLSFFPPPSTSGKTPSISLTLTPNYPNPKPLSTYPRHSIAPSLTSILTALPIAASTRDDILARLSFDSVSSSFSDRSRQSFEQDERHEMDVVSNHATKTVKASNSQGHAGDNTVDLSSPFASLASKPRHHKRRAAADAVVTNSKRPQRGGRLRHPSNSPPAAYISQMPDRTIIRTVQLEPSPMMQLPTLRSRKSQQPVNANTGSVIIHHDDVFELRDSGSRHIG